LRRRRGWVWHELGWDERVKSNPMREAVNGLASSYDGSWVKRKMTFLEGRVIERESM